MYVAGIRTAQDCESRRQLAADSPLLGCAVLALSQNGIRAHTVCWHQEYAGQVAKPFVKGKALVEVTSAVRQQNRFSQFRVAHRLQWLDLERFEGGDHSVCDQANASGHVGLGSGIYPARHFLVVYKYGYLRAAGRDR